MKLTFSTLASPDWTLDQIIHHAVANGITGIDFRGIGSQLDITQLPEFTTGLSDTLQLLRDRQLQMPCLNASIALVTPDESQWDAMVQEARRYAKLASQTGTRFLRVFGGAIPADMTRQAARELARQHLREIAAITTPMGCKPLLETHDAWVLGEIILDLLGDIDASAAGVLWDLEHPWRAGESPSATAEMLKGRIEHVHIKDTIRQNGKSVPKLLGEGEIPLLECLSALKQMGYRGWICLETEKRWHAEGPEPEISLPQFARFMQRSYL
jgi:sugar phosphate isomerase/epimerase